MAALLQLARVREEQQRQQALHWAFRWVMHPVLPLSCHAVMPCRHRAVKPPLPLGQTQFATLLQVCSTAHSTGSRQIYNQLTANIPCTPSHAYHAPLQVLWAANNTPAGGVACTAHDALPCAPRSGERDSDGALVKHGPPELAKRMSLPISRWAQHLALGCALSQAGLVAALQGREAAGHSHASGAPGGGRRRTVGCALRPTASALQHQANRWNQAYAHLC
jgi:hypothetical protein